MTKRIFLIAMLALFAAALPAAGTTFIPPAVPPLNWTHAPPTFGFIPVRAGSSGTVGTIEVHSIAPVEAGAYVYDLGSGASMVWESPVSFRIPPRGRQNVTVSAIIPAGTSRGLYYAEIWIKNYSMSPPVLITTLWLNVTG